METFTYYVHLYLLGKIKMKLAPLQCFWMWKMWKWKALPEECSSLQRNPYSKNWIIWLWDYFADTNETWIAPEKIRSGLKYENSISIFQSWRWCFTFYYTYTLWNEWAFVAINHWKGQKPAEFSYFWKKLSQSSGVSRKGQASNVKP